MKIQGLRPRFTFVCHVKLPLSSFRVISECTLTCSSSVRQELCLHPCLVLKSPGHTFFFYLYERTP